MTFSMEEMRGAAIVPDKGIGLFRIRRRDHRLRPGDRIRDGEAEWLLKTFLASTGIHRDTAEVWEVEDISKYRR